MKGFEKNGLRVGERITCIDVPGSLGTVIRCAEDGVDVRWDDGGLGEAIWDQTVAYNAYRFQVVRGEGSHRKPTRCECGGPLLSFSGFAYCPRCTPMTKPSSAVVTSGS